MANLSLKQQLLNTGCTVKEQEPMCAHTTFKIGGCADYFAVAHTTAQAAAVLRLCHEQQIPLLLLGNGSNLLVRDNGIEGVVLKLEGGDCPLTVDGTVVTVSAGMTLSKLCTAVCERGLSGLEFAFGIPGTVGGGVYMNAGAYGGQLSDVIQRVTVLTEQGETRELSAEELELDYRHSRLMRETWLVVSVTLNLTSDAPAAIRARMDDFLCRRREKQPLEYPSAGSFFKRPAGQFAGALIEQCGMKGRSVGAAQISEKHAGFLINCGGATCAEVLALSAWVQQAVQEAFDVTLEREVRLVGRE